MDTLDLLISGFLTVKEELQKGSSPLYNSVPEFLAGLKAIPKGDPARGQFITQHMNHGPFLTALQNHPQGPQIHSMLTAHLNSPQNAGFKPGQVKTMVKNQEIENELEKGFKDKTMAGQALNDAYKDAMRPQQGPNTLKPTVPAPHPNTLPSPEEQAARADMYGDFMPPGKWNSVGKNEECVKFDKNGQWSLEKGAIKDAAKAVGKGAAIGALAAGVAAGPILTHESQRAKQAEAENTKHYTPKSGPSAKVKTYRYKNGKLDTDSMDLEKTHVGFKKLQEKLENEGHSDESSAKIAAAIGRNKYGAKKMTAMAHKSETCDKCGKSPCECSN